jgi:hypothetical protein
MACETPDRAVIFVESDGSEPDRSGRLARVWLRRPLQTHEALGKTTGRYRDPHPLPDGRLLVSHDPEGKGFGLYAFDVSKEAPGERLFDDPSWNDVDGMAICARPEPLGRITMVNEKAKTAALTCLNVYDSSLPEVSALPRGTVKKVRFIEGIPGRDRRAPQARILGEAPVETDGSFLVQMVAETPFTLEILDGDDRVVGAMRSWIWLQRGDERGCMGCHENKEMSPENRITEALLKGKPWAVLSPPEERRMVDFVIDRDLRVSNGSVVK